MTQMIFAGISMIVLYWIVAIILAIVWMVLPFAIFGTKPLLRELIERQERTNVLLAQLLNRERDGKSSDFSAHS